NCEKGPTPIPCNNCPSCREITQGTSLDILEIDGASNRGIDEVRSLRENAKFSPSKGSFKVYIIDEVHMLSADAFNALLKILEEPPPHLKFIFATTHPHKVPPTILSRCQRFDFKRIPALDIMKSLKMIVKEEKMDADDEALGLISKYSDGSLRDAQVVLDQIASLTGGKIEADDVAKILGIVEDDILFGLSGAIKDRDSKKALKIIDQLIDDGKDVVQIILNLIEHFRNIVVAKTGDELNTLIDAGPDKIGRYSKEAESFTIEETLYIIYTLSATLDFVRKTNLPRIPFESALVKLTRLGIILPIDEILKRIDKIEQGYFTRRSETGQAIKSADSKDQNPGERHSLENEGMKDAAGYALRPADNKIDAEGDLATPSQCGLSLEEILSAWNKVINYIKGRKISIASYLEE
ncbi:MAG: DNA polymerase III subunit gamma/tau, partial [Candidatus Omnitrophica bacterium]|nr:DNA polymerase III subunit gamma/tau [Candidatus Omnitrophota bacterium]